MNETFVTVQGYVATDPEQREAGGGRVTSFRVGSTPRRFNRMENSWVDGETNWYTVNAWRTLGEHCLASLCKGEAVIVHGRLRVNSWTDQDGRDHQSLVVEAVTAGHDLNRGTSVFTKAPPRQVATQGDDDDLRHFNALVAASASGQMTSDGTVIDEPAA